MDMIAIDLDGTLLNAESRISDENIEAIHLAQQKGVEVVIATGRAEFDVRNLIADVDLSIWVIAANGATIHRPDGTIHNSVPMEKKDVALALAWLEYEEFYYEVIDDHSILTPQNGRELLEVELDRIRSANPKANVTQMEESIKKQFSQTGFLPIDSYREIIEKDRNVYNILAFSFDVDKLKEGWEKFRAYPAVTLVSSADHNFELEHKTASKGMALERLSDKLGLSIKQTGVIGDSLNDLSMFAVAGHSVAMGNAKNEVKKASDFVTKTNDENGVAHAIHHFLN